MSGAKGGVSRRVSERGSEAVQSVAAVTLVLFVVFSVVQAGGMMLSVSRLTADLARACAHFDAAGLALAADKEAFAASEVLGAATQLRPENLQVTNVSVTFREDAGSASPAGEAAAVAQRTDVARVSFDVAYELPSAAAVPGLAHRTVARHVVCEQVAGRVVEVQVRA